MSTRREFEFEYALGGFVFDLALLDKRILVEFDGPDHRGEGQRITDVKKDEIAKKHGFVVIRRQVYPISVIDPEVVVGL